MQFKKLLPKQSLNKAYLKEKLSRSAIDQFKHNFSVFLNHTNDNKGDEEHLKSQVAYFLRDTWYKHSHHINPIGKNDLVIHTGKTTADPVGVIIEVKSLTNKAEMIGLQKPNAKAFHELVLYYLRQRIDENNNEIKYLVATNIDEWFIFDANEFDKKVFRNTAIKRLYELKKSDGKDNPWFYDELKKLLDSQTALELELTHLNLRDFEQVVQNADGKDDNRLIGIYKILSPVHLLKLPFANDSNSLQPKFYAELLHLIGLTEVKEGSKKLIQRRKAGERNSGSLLENTINTLDTHDKISRLAKPSVYGDTHEERLFNVALELVITWVNRILFLKLLEAQLTSYHKGDKSYRFLNKERIQDFDDLDKLFFSVLAKKPEERREEINKLFGKVPYLNSSLFEPTELEHQTLFISNLEDRVALPLLNSTVLKSPEGKPLKGSLHTIDYLFAFLDAYDFSSEGSEEIQEDNKTLINASVLGLIFEKINGYKDGSFFTPGFITMYMCRETIRRAVVQKFNDAKGWNCKEYGELYDRIDDTKEANEIINSLKICDPAVGSGHFLVSALNEIIAIKSDLRILLDRDGRRLKEYQLEVVNDELIITDEDAQLFDYNPKSKESQRVQEVLFHEKQTIIESCLFGVDINPNSVKICRLRLWIELLKNAYYKESGQLETLPNIDINIKTGNSLISRFALDADLKQALKKSKFSIDAYKIAVQTYRNAKDKDEKREMESLIRTIKSDFRTEIGRNDPKLLKLNRLGGELYNITNQQQIFAESKAEIKARKAKQERLEREVNALSAEVEEIKNNKIYENAFEWRFEFPEVLNDDGDFVGFDVVIGNPPYGVSFSKEEKTYFRNSFKTILGKYDSYGFFIEKGLELLKFMGLFGFIVPNTWLTVKEARQTRNLIFNRSKIIEIDKLPGEVFEDAKVDTTNLILQKEEVKHDYLVKVLVFNLNSKILSLYTDFSINQLHTVSSWVENDSINLRIGNSHREILEKVIVDTVPFSKIFEFSVGVQAYDSYTGQSKEIIQDRIYHSTYKKDNTFLPELNGSDVARYCINQKKESWIAYGAWLAHPRSEKFFFSPRILVREITSKGKYKLVCCFTDEISINYKSILNIVAPDNNRDHLIITLAILNSSFMSWFFNLNSNKLESNSFPRVSLLDLKKFPLSLKAFDSRFSHLIKNKAKEILDLKKRDPEADISAMELEIDQLVYQLYGLTEEEIKIVEGEG